MYEYSSRFLNDIQKVAKLFKKITNNDIIFVNTSGILVDHNTILYDQNIALGYIKKLELEQYIIFPVTINNSLIGFFILDTVNLEPEEAKLCGKYIQVSVSEIIDDDTDDVQILNQIEIPKISPLVKTFNGLLGISREQTQLANAPGFSVSGDNGQSGEIEKNITMALKYINANIKKPLTLENVSQKIFLSPSYLSRIFKNYFNDNFINYINSQKIALAQEKLAFTNVPINKLAQQIGFSQTSYFTKIFKQKVGMTPSKYRKYNTAIKRIYTIPRDLFWRTNQSVYAISKDYFSKGDIPFLAHNVNGYPYIYSIDNLADVRGKSGWVYTVDCAQPASPASEVNVVDKSVIQWIYTEKLV